MLLQFWQFCSLAEQFGGNSASRGNLSHISPSSRLITSYPVPLGPRLIRLVSSEAFLSPSTANDWTPQRRTANPRIGSPRRRKHGKRLGVAPSQSYPYVRSIRLAAEMATADQPPGVPDADPPPARLHPGARSTSTTAATRHARAGNMSGDRGTPPSRLLPALFPPYSPGNRRHRRRCGA